MTAFHPASPEELLQCVREAHDSQRRLEVVGGGSKRTFGRPVTADAVLFLDQLQGIRTQESAEMELFPLAALLDPTALRSTTRYRPEEMALTAGPGTRIADLERTLQTEGQRLPFEPPDWGPLLGAPPGRSTLGGAMACNLAGPRKLRAGGPREHCLALEAVDGAGRAIRSDPRHTPDPRNLPRLLAGTFGTLAVYTALTVRVITRPVREFTLVLQGQSADETALQLLSSILHDPFAITGAAHLPITVAAALPGAPGPGPLTLVRLEGAGAQIARRREGLENFLGRYGELVVLEDDDAQVLWQGIANVAPFVGAPSVVWRLTLPPRAAARVVAEVQQHWLAEAYYDWGGELVWLALAPGGLGADGLADGGASVVRKAVAGVSGAQAVMVRAPESTRLRLSPFPPPSLAQTALNRSLKMDFDPQGVLNPGRMHPGG